MFLIVVKMADARVFMLKLPIATSSIREMPRLRASRPKEVWTWDITKLPTRQRGVYLCLYMVLDLFSRFVVAWMVSRKENSALAKQLIQEVSIRCRRPMSDAVPTLSVPQLSFTCAKQPFRRIIPSRAVWRFYAAGCGGASSGRGRQRIRCRRVQQGPSANAPTRVA
jgi:transposase InsO family protein